MKLVPKPQLPERFKNEGLDVIECSTRSLPTTFIEQLIAKSRQPHVQAFEGHEDIGTEAEPGRFRTVDAYRAWAAGKERTMYMMVRAGLRDHALDIGGIIWFGQREHPRAPGRDVTFAIRNYAADEEQGWGQYVGRGLGSPFMQVAHEQARNIYPEQKTWLDLVEGNAAAERLYGNNGYQEIARFADDAHDGQSRVVMVNDTAFQKA